MKVILLECVICVIVAALLMMAHEFIKAVVYVMLRRYQNSYRKPEVSIFCVWKYIDVLGLILALCCRVPVSKPHMFRIRDKMTNRILGTVGFAFLLAVFSGSILVLRYYYGGMSGLEKLEANLAGEVAALFWQYLAMLSFGMLVANLFPVSTFDMGLLIAGSSAGYYLQIIKSDVMIKLLFVLTLLLDLIHYGCVKLLFLLL